MVWHRAKADKLIKREGRFREFSNRDKRAVNRDGANGNVKAATIWQARITKGLTFINTATDFGDNAVYNPQEMGFIRKSNG